MTGKPRPIGPSWMILAWVLATASLLVGLRHGFYLDDFTWLERAHLAGHSALRAATPWKSYEVRSVGQLLYWLEYLVFRDHAWGYNLVSLALHVGVTMLVVRLARVSGLSARLAAVAGLLFYAGVGHYTKPVAWSCAQVIVLGTLFALAAVVHFLEIDVHRERFPYLPVAMLALGLATHEVVILAPLGLAFLAHALRHPARRALLGVGLVMTGAYVAITLPYHLAHPVAHGSLRSVLENLLLFPAAYLFTPQATKVVSRFGALGVPGEEVLAAVRVGLMLVGALLLVLGARAAWRAQSRQRIVIAFGLLLFFPVLPMPTQENWIEVRYLYPTSSFLLPSVTLGLAALLERVSASRRLLLRIAFGIWFLGVLAGGAYVQHRAYQESHLPRVEQRWERLSDVREGRPPRW
ncbi:MAG: hypothetical protein U0527_10765 [Candidatus Eisenbacteria bacterium]